MALTPSCHAQPSNCSSPASGWFLRWRISIRICFKILTNLALFVCIPYVYYLMTQHWRNGRLGECLRCTVAAAARSNNDIVYRWLLIVRLDFTVVRNQFLAFDGGILFAFHGHGWLEDTSYLGYRFNGENIRMGFGAYMRGKYIFTSITLLCVCGVIVVVAGLVFVSIDLT